jgi:hypothetical protein
MGLFDRFRKRNDEPLPTPASQRSLPSICYGVAYFVLPHYAFKDCDKLASMFRDTPTSAGPFFYLMGCQVQKTEPVHEDAPRLRAHHGDFDATHDYFVLEYPTPPPVDLSGTDPTRLPAEQLPVLAPYFSAIVRNRATKAVRYYTLGQAPFGGGTTLRSVTPEGANCNHGPGPEPRLDAFLARLRSAR